MLVPSSLGAHVYVWLQYVQTYVETKGLERRCTQTEIGNSLIEFDEKDENTAYGEIYFNAYHKTIENGVNTDVIIAGRYLDRYEKRDGIWKIAYRSEVNDWSRTEPTNDPYFDDSDCHRGKRQDDDVYHREKMYKP